jgi:hypothetical protein
MPSVQRRNLLGLQTFGCCHDRGVHGSEQQITVSPHQLGYAGPVPRLYWLNKEIAGREIPKKMELGGAAKAAFDQVDDLGDHEMRNDQWAGMGFKQLPAHDVVTITPIHGRVEGAGIDDERYLPNSSLRISSILSEMSSRPLSPAPAENSVRRGPGRR